jgi:aminoglycoside phosphotransferase (APT) family kinase protein
VTKTHEPPTAFARDLLATLREATGDDHLRYESEPAVLSGGFYAEMSAFRLADPPAGLEGELVARVVPNATLGTWESTIQREVAAQGFPTPAIRLTAPETSALGRYLMVMDRVHGEPPLSGLSFGSIVRQYPTLTKHLPDQLATMAARLHALDAEPLQAQLADLDDVIALTTADFVEWQLMLAAVIDDQELVRTAERLLDTRPTTGAQVISHGDLHPFNLLITETGPVLIDWTVARVAHPAFTVAFTDLMLSNPPIALPRPAAAGLRAAGRSLARRFPHTNKSEGTAAGQIDDDQFTWHRLVHSLRILVELAGWDAAGTRPAGGHPWFVVEPAARACLGLPLR